MSNEEIRQEAEKLRDDCLDEAMECLRARERNDPSGVTTNCINDISWLQSFARKHGITKRSGDDTATLLTSFAARARNEAIEEAAQKLEWDYKNGVDEYGSPERIRSLKSQEATDGKENHET